MGIKTRFNPMGGFTWPITEFPVQALQGNNYRALVKNNTYTYINYNMSNFTVRSINDIKFRVSDDTYFDSNNRLYSPNREAINIPNFQLFINLKLGTTTIAGAYVMADNCLRFYNFYSAAGDYIVKDYSSCQSWYLPQIMSTIEPKYYGTGLYINGWVGNWSFEHVVTASVPTGNSNPPYYISNFIRGIPTGNMLGIFKSTTNTTINVPYFKTGINTVAQIKAAIVIYSSTKQRITNINRSTYTSEHAIPDNTYFSVFAANYADVNCTNMVINNVIPIFGKG